MLNKLIVAGLVVGLTSFGFAGMAPGRNTSKVAGAGDNVSQKGPRDPGICGLGDILPGLKEDPAVQAELERHRTALENLRASGRAIIAAIGNDVKNGVDRQTAINNHYNEMLEQAKKRIAEALLFHKNLASIVEQKEGDLAKQIVDRLIAQLGQRGGDMRGRKGPKAGRGQPNAVNAPGRATAEF